MHTACCSGRSCESQLSSATSCSANFRQAGPHSLRECLSWPATAVASGGLFNAGQGVDNWSHLLPRLTKCHIRFASQPACPLCSAHKNSGSLGDAIKKSAIVRPPGPFPTPTSQHFLSGKWGGHFKFDGVATRACLIAATYPKTCLAKNIAFHKRLTHTWFLQTLYLCPGLGQHLRKQLWVALRDIESGAAAKK